LDCWRPQKFASLSSPNPPGALMSQRRIFSVVRVRSSSSSSNAGKRIQIGFHPLTTHLRKAGQACGSCSPGMPVSIKTAMAIRLVTARRSIPSRLAGHRRLSGCFFALRCELPNGTGGGRSPKTVSPALSQPHKRSLLVSASGCVGCFVNPLPTQRERLSFPRSATVPVNLNSKYVITYWAPGANSATWVQ